MSFGDDSPPTPTYATTTTKSDPWSGQQPFLTTGFAKAQEDILNKPAQLYPNSMVVPFSNQTESALGQQEALATRGSPAISNAATQVASTLGGDFLNQGNPAFQAMTDRVKNSVLPAIDSKFAAGGRFGSGQHARMAAQGMADALAPVAYQNYQDERTNQLRAGALAPSIAQAEYMPSQMLGDVGAAREGMAGKQLQEQMLRFNQPDQAKRDAVAQYMALVGGGSFGGSSTQTTPMYSTPGWQTGLGAAAAGAGILGDMFGMGGPFAKGGSLRFWGN